MLCPPQVPREEDRLLTPRQHTDVRAVNDGPVILGTAGEQPIGVLTLDVADGVVQALWFVANPDKLSGLGGEAPAGHGLR